MRIIVFLAGVLNKTPMPGKAARLIGKQLGTLLLVHASVGVLLPGKGRGKSSYHIN